MRLIIFIILFIICAGIVGALFNRKALSVFPALASTLLLIAYALAITNHLSRAVVMCELFMMIISIICGICLIYKKSTGMVKKAYLDYGLFIFALAVIFIIVAFKGHIVTNWDDFNYWANFPKNLYCSDAFVSGARSATSFKDYMPIVQIYLYLAMKLFGTLDEGVMFVAHNLLILIFMIPFFELSMEDRSRNAIKLATGMLLIPAFSFQPFHCLGVDIIISAIFGYLLIRILTNTNRDLYFYIECLAILSVLPLVKTVSMLPMVIIILLLAIDTLGEKTIAKIYTAFISIVPALSYISWIVFCRLKGNTSYLSDKAISNVSKRIITLPDYAGVVVGNFFKEIFAMHLNGGSIGATAFVGILFIAVIVKYGFKDKKYKLVSWLVILAGFIGYTVSLLYTYLFVFEEWEALSLSSFDRYISMYLLGGVFVCAYELCEHFFFDKDMRIYLLALPLTLFISLNFSFLYNMLCPPAYGKYVAGIASKREVVENEINEFFNKEPSAYQSRVLVVNKERDDELEKYQQYALVPAVSYICYEGEDVEAIAAEHAVDSVLYY